MFKANCKAKHWQLRPNSGCPSNHTSALLCECPVIHFRTARTSSSFPSSVQRMDTQQDRINEQFEYWYFLTLKCLTLTFSPLIPPWFFECVLCYWFQNKHFTRSEQRYFCPVQLLWSYWFHQGWIWPVTSNELYIPKSILIMPGAFFK